MSQWLRSIATVYSTHLAQEPSQFIVFSTHNLLCIYYNTADKDLWRSMVHTKYWKRLIWILPIHHASSWGHWVLCSIHFNSHHLLLFNSLRKMHPWKINVLVC